MSTFYFAGYFTQSLLPRRNGSRVFRSLTAVALVSLILCVPCFAQIPHARKVAASGEVGQGHVFETQVALGRNVAFGVYVDGWRLSPQVGFSRATYDGQTWNWSAGQLLDPAGGRAIDPVIAYNAFETHPTDPDEFVVAALVFGKGIAVARSLPDPPEYFTDWQPTVDWGPAVGTDKPWIVAGSYREYYLIYTHQPSGKPRGYAYLRSSDGGATWYPQPGPMGENGPIRLPDGTRIEGEVGATAAVYGTGPLYVAYLSNGKIRVLRGVDVIDLGPDVVRFDHLSNTACGGPPTPLEIPLVDPDLWVGGNPRIPNLVRGAGTVTSPQVVVDSTNPNRVYVVFHDVADPNFDPDDPDVDVDVFLQRLIQTSPGCWSLDGARVRVNDPNPPVGTADQVLPAVWVDTLGRIHVVFYDDRDFPDQIDYRPGTPQLAQFNVYYAYSMDGGHQFQANAKLFLNPNPMLDPPSLDFSVETSGTFEVGEYIGVAVFRDATRYHALTVSTGTDVNDPGSNAVIWSSLVTWPQP